MTAPRPTTHSLVEDGRGGRVRVEASANRRDDTICYVNADVCHDVRIIMRPRGLSENSLLRLCPGVACGRCVSWRNIESRRLVAAVEGD